MSEIVFTDRYGGNSPAWLRGCHGHCEAMGFYPTKDIAEWPAGTRPYGQPDEDGAEDDGWRFIKCQQCKGTGRVSWLVSVARIPRWIWKGLKFYPHAMSRDMNPPHFRWMDRFKLWLWCSFGAEVTKLKREIWKRDA